MTRTVLICLAMLVLAAIPRGGSSLGVRIGSKKFTESVILGEIVTRLLRSKQVPATHLAELGGTRIVYDALVRGEIDMYPEYTGTLSQEIFASRGLTDEQDLASALAQDGLKMSRPLGFNNSYALAVTRETAEKYHLETISDLATHPELELGLSNEFLDREDGWKNLRQVCSLPQQAVGMDHDIAFRQLAAGTIDVTDVYTTEARLAELDLVLLEDDRGFFPRYDAVLLYREQLIKQVPAVQEVVEQLAGSLSESKITALNAEVESGRAREAKVASQYLKATYGIKQRVKEASVSQQIWQRTLEHLDLVRRSLVPAIFAAIPLGIFAAKKPKFGQLVLGAVGIVQTIPALALLVLLIAPIAYLGLGTLGTGSATAIAALFLYSLLPIVRNTATGISGIAPEYRESALALGLSPLYRLLHVELPLASPAILAGIKTAAVLNVGFATLGALVGARGYGQPILTGIRLNDTSLILQGAIPAACLAVLLQAVFELLERWLVPAGLQTSDKRASHVAT